MPFIFVSFLRQQSRILRAIHLRPKAGLSLPKDFEEFLEKGDLQSTIMIKTHGHQLTAIPIVYNVREIQPIKLVGLYEKIGNANITPHNVIVGIQLKKQYPVAPFLFIYSWIFLGEIGISAELMPGITRSVVQNI